MLHEVLLALSGHPSPLFNQTYSSDGRPVANKEFPLLSPSELSLLQKLGSLAECHRLLRQQLSVIANSHESMPCRAVANSIQHTHLARFQQKIIDVESRILTTDASLVGGYNIVPLSSIVEEFDEWHRLMSWYYDIAQCMQTPDQADKIDNRSFCSSAALIDKLRREHLTGFADIEAAANELSTVAERSWLRQLLPWLLYGTLPTHGREDFIIQRDGTSVGAVMFRKDMQFAPSFVTPTSASSILYIGKTLSYIEVQSKGSNDHTKQMQRAKDVWSNLLSEHMAHLSSLSFPISSTTFTQAIASIRRSLSKNVLQRLLPRDTIVLILSCLRQFFLFSRGEFAVALLVEAQKRMNEREQSMGTLLREDPIKAMRALPIRDTELQQTLSDAWKMLIREDHVGDDNLVEFARRHINMSIVRKHETRPLSAGSEPEHDLQFTPTTFDDLIFPTPSNLSLTMPTPMDLLISTRDLQIYSVISSYLLAIRRARLNLSDLWRRSSARRANHKTQADPNMLRHNTPSTLDHDLRKVWATCSGTLFFISELAAHFDGEVIKGFFGHFETWLRTPVGQRDMDEVPDTSTMNGLGAQRDPETLAVAHRTMLTAMSYRLLLTDIVYTRELRTMMGHLDAFIAYIIRLLDLVQKLETVDDTYGLLYERMIGERRLVIVELEKARVRVENALQRVLDRLRTLDQERVRVARTFDGAQTRLSEYQPWQGSGGLERLLMKLEYSRMPTDGN